MKKIFLDKEFEFGGTLQNLDKNKGNFPGVYLIVLPDNFGKVVFLKESNLKLYRGKEVAVYVKELQKKWIETAPILYIGRRLTKTVRSRVEAHIKFWDGKNIAAFGGRIIGQIKDWKNLEVWYLKCDDPAKTEKELLKAFKNRYENLPFANWRE